MRLSKIKLTGFKSFVEPAVLHLPSDLVGVVGPNGCGKSNIIDAVRWVLGESSARSLRGASMSDVIFNGSTTRKALDQAQIELVFDNSAGRLSGPWAQCAEVAVRRVLERNGQSSYFLNGTRCRRRDVADLFLGTGLGARSYAIIEQGMISRVVEARPEDLRLMLEEAAGISKYKERRRETETRIAHARENLERCNDVREEMRRQLQHVQRQAKAAAQYQEYRAIEQRLRSELLTRRWHQLQQAQQELEQALQQHQATLTTLQAEQQHCVAQLASGREQQSANQDALHLAQQRIYHNQASITRLEQQLQHQREVQQRHTQDVQDTLTALQQVAAQQAADEEQAAHLHTALAAAELEAQSLQAAEIAAKTTLSAAETAWRAVQNTWEAGQQSRHQLQQRSEVERSKIEQWERQAMQSERRLQRLELEGAQLNIAALQQEEQELSERYQLLSAALQEAEQGLSATATALQAIEPQRHHIEALLRATQERLQTGNATLSALRTLQAAALGHAEPAVQEWLQAQGLQDAPRLADCVTVSDGWEGAAEAALAGWLNAICVNDLQQVTQAPLPHGQLTLLELQPAPESCASAPDAVWQAPWPLPSLLPQIRSVPDLASALAQRPNLPADTMLVTPQGACCGRHWLRLPSADPGIVARRRAIHALETMLQEAQHQAAEQSAALQQLLERRNWLEQQRRAQQQALQQAQQQQAPALAAMHRAQARCEQLQARLAAVSAEQEELCYQMQQDADQVQQARQRLQQALAELETMGAAQTLLHQQRDAAQTAQHQARAAYAATRQAMANHATRMETMRVQSAASATALQRLAAQQQQLQQRYQQLLEQGAADSTAAAAALAECLGQREALQAALVLIQQRLAADAAQLDATQQQQHAGQQHVERVRLQLEEQRLALGEVRIKEQLLRDQMQELGTTPEQVFPQLAATAQESDLQTALQQMERRIQRLGAINLAALEECSALQERQQYLDAQHSDLLEALQTLESAIRKIDRETRTRLRNTFGQVNAGLQELFPRLFGGGEAHLQLSSDEVLEAGVTIMAKPPGKRITSISLLSGGEKALTAVALVFAIFQLNPAPFCLLDEVDAPLDDANVRRFGALVREMASRVQFIFITHNKATMEIAEHLAGVTMQEPGVSRLVAVDVVQAVRLAGSA